MTDKEFNLSERISELEGLPERLPVIHKDFVKEFIKKVERIIIARKTKREQLIKLGKLAGPELI